MKIKFRIILDCETSGETIDYTETLSTDELKGRATNIITKDITELINEWGCNGKFKIDNIEVI